MADYKSTHFKDLDRDLIMKDAEKILSDPYRRYVLKHGLTLGGLLMVSGCKLGSGHSVEQFFKTIGGFNTKAQAALFNPNDLAPEYPDSLITRPFPFNAYYPETDIRPAPPDFKLRVSGLVGNNRDVTLASLHAMPQTTQVTRHICVEGWSAIGKWGGVRFSDFLQRIGADTTAKYVGFKCLDDYFTSIDMPTALHAQTLLTLTYDGEILPAKYGFPMKLRMPTKLGL